MIQGCVTHNLLRVDDELIAVILEVHNTFGEKHIYVVRYPTKSQSIAHRLHLSPFNDRLGRYQCKTISPEAGITIELTLLTPEAKPKLVGTQIEIWSFC